LPAVVSETGEVTLAPQDSGYSLQQVQEARGQRFARLERDGVSTWWHLVDSSKGPRLEEALSITKLDDGGVLYNGAPKEEGKFYQVGHMSKIIVDGKEVDSTGPLSPLKFLSVVNDGEVVRFQKTSLASDQGKVTVYYQNPTPGSRVMRPGLKFKVDKGAKFWDKLNFVSLMLALFFGTSALPHILIRYYTVPSPRCARKSTIVAIAAIGFFYVLTLFMGIGAMVSGVVDVESSNMSAPLLAKLFGTPLFAVISAIAFATILGTVSGLIVAASGAVAHDLMDRYLHIEMSDKGKVIAGKIAAVTVGILAILLGIVFKGMNVSFLVGLAFAVAASANLPAILMLLFWKKTTAKGIAASILIGMVSALVLILLSPSMFERYGLGRAAAPIPLDNPGIISIPLSFLALVVVSLMTQKKGEAEAA
jgi:cation/acetate symporter